MTFPMSLSQSDYETLVELARRGTLDAKGNVISEAALSLDFWLRDLEQRNGIQRSAIWIQWQEQDAPLPPGTMFPEVWPPDKRYHLALVSRPITRGDVETILAAKASQPTNIMVTRDPAAIVGWTQLDAFFK